MEMITTHEKIALLIAVSIFAMVYVTAAGSLIRSAFRYVRGRPAPARSRRRRVVRTVVLSLAAIGVLCMLYAYYIEPYWPKVETFTVTTPRMAKGAQPIRIVHLSDTHCDPKVRLEDRLPGIVQGLKPDLILFTGDAANSPEGLPNFRRLMKALSAIAPTYAVQGNWDYPNWDGPLYRGIGVTNIQSTTARTEVRGTPIHLIGMAFSTQRDLERALVAPPGSIKIALAHFPDFIDKTAGRVDLYLAGHTHGGQIAVPFYGAIVTLTQHGKRFEGGMYEVEGTAMHVSRGIGMEGRRAPRMRFFARPDVAVIELRPE